MRYLTTISMDESMPAGPPPPELFEAIGKLGEEGRKDGSLVLEGGLYPSAEGALIHISDGKVSVVDGPFTEAKEVVGGYAIFEVRSREEIIERTRQFAQLHADLWPGVSATCEVRRMYEAGDEPSFG